MWWVSHRIESLRSFTLKELQGLVGQCWSMSIEEVSKFINITINMLTVLVYYIKDQGADYFFCLSEKEPGVIKRPGGAVLSDNMREGYSYYWTTTFIPVFSEEWTHRQWPSESPAERHHYWRMTLRLALWGLQPWRPNRFCFVTLALWYLLK